MSMKKELHRYNIVHWGKLAHNLKVIALDWL